MPYSPPAHTWEQMGLNFHLQHPGLPAAIPAALGACPSSELYPRCAGERREKGPGGREEHGCVCRVISVPWELGGAPGGQGCLFAVLDAATIIYY